MCIEAGLSLWYCFVSLQLIILMRWTSGFHCVSVWHCVDIALQGSSCVIFLFSCFCHLQIWLGGKNQKYKCECVAETALKLKCIRLLLFCSSTSLPPPPPFSCKHSYPGCNPKGRPGISDDSPLSGLSGLSLITCFIITSLVLLPTPIAFSVSSFSHPNSPFFFFPENSRFCVKR